MAKKKPAPKTTKRTSSAKKPAPTIQEVDSLPGDELGPREFVPKPRETATKPQRQTKGRSIAPITGSQETTSRLDTGNRASLVLGTPAPASQSQPGPATEPDKPGTTASQDQPEPASPDQHPTAGGGMVKGNGAGDDDRPAPLSTTASQETRAGDVHSSGASADSSVGSGLTREESQAEATRRWRREGIAEQVAVYRDQKREEYRAANPKAKRRDGHEYAWQCAMAAFPPAGDSPEPTAEPVQEPKPEPAAPQSSNQGVVGLGDIPPGWPELPANASLQAEIAWVSANRLRVRDGTGVDLSRAMSPAPSYSALSWLETSILFPAKFADISVKASAQPDDEREMVRREKLAIEDVRAILREMLEAR